MCLPADDEAILAAAKGNQSNRRINQEDDFPEEV
jgi:hypothetical protein